MITRREGLGERDRLGVWDGHCTLLYLKQITNIDKNRKR